MKRLYLTSLFCIWIVTLITSQSYNNWEKIIFFPDSCQISLDAFTFDPSSLCITPFIPYSIQENILYFHCDRIEEMKGQPIEIKYRKLEMHLKTPQFFLDSSQLTQKETAVYIGYDYSPYKKPNSHSLIERGNMQYQGSISRGFSVGNSQNLLLNSNLNLQLNGELGNGIKVAAAISDDNIPIQADGNTRLLQEFDRVFIQVQKDHTGIIAGDYDLMSQPSHFIRYYKKLQGLRVDHQVANNDQPVIATSVNMAVSRGKFARQQIPVQEGNQGPYKLQGNNGERFLIVLQGSERIYLDGNLLIRGQDFDYIIDYNNAEITFTQQRIISRELRIIAEFEYTDQNYLRTLYAIQSQYESDKLSLSFDFYNEQDSKNATGQIELDSTDISILSNATNDPLSLFRSGIRNPLHPDQIAANAILYRKEWDNMAHDTILVYAGNPSGFVEKESLVSATFSEVGPGKGDYIIDNQAGANGRVYKFVGKGKGTYLPVIRLVAPEKRQMMSLSASARPFEHSTLTTELSLSHFDDNRYSNIDHQDNQGMAARFEYRYELPKNQTVKWKPVIETGYEYIDENFRFLNPFRNQEFHRDWNTEFLERSNEHLAFVSFQIEKADQIQLGHKLSTYRRGVQYQGLKNDVLGRFRSENTRIDVNGSLLSTQSELETTQFFRPDLDIRQNLSFLDDWAIRFRYFAEKNERINRENDELLPSSFSFEEFYVFLESPENEKKHLSLFGKHRTDHLPNEYRLAKATSIYEGGVQGYLNHKSSQLRWNVSYRNFMVKNTELISNESASTLLGRLDYGFEVLKGFIQSSSSIQFGSGQEAKREFQFIRVEKGQGNYIYLGDLNNDGKDQINEYELAVFSDEADFIRVNVFNNEFIRTENKTLNQSLRIMPERWIRDRSTFLKRVIRKLSLNSVLKLDKKNSFDSGRGPLLNFNYLDSNLVAYQGLINNTLFINRGNPLFDIQTGHRKSNHRFVQITGYEDRRDERIYIRSRINPKKHIDLITQIEKGNQYYDSEFIDSRDLNLDFWALSPSIVYRPGNSWRITGKYSYEERRQKINDREHAKQNALTLEMTYREAVTSDLRFSMSLVNIQYEGDINAPVAYSILSGLNQGNNYLWNIQYTRRMSGNVDFNISYDGRKTGHNRTVHVARAQVRAHF
ncbi:MAG TPA: hypothetical protein PKC30_04205 [Saprospiraceae bacterium]|nr:hypothetical protein [Saprospiraceae bacterium]